MSLSAAREGFRTCVLALAQFARNRLKPAVRLSKWLFTPLALGFLLAAGWQSRAVIQDTLQHSAPVYLLLATLAYMGIHLVAPLFARTALNTGAARVDYSETLGLHLRYLPTRYLPGGVWHTVARINGLRQLGVGPRHLSRFVLLENLIALGVTCGVGGILVGFSQTGGGWRTLALLAAIAGGVLLAALPAALNRWLLSGEERLSPRRYGAAGLLMGLSWVAASASFLLFLAAFPNLTPASAWFETVGAYLLAWGIGFVALFAPQGVGVFEVVVANLVPTNLSFTSLVALLVGFRLVALVADLSMWVGWMLWESLRGEPTPSRLQVPPPAPQVQGKPQQQGQRQTEARPQAQRP